MPGSSELISWTEKSDDQKNAFKIHVGGIIHGGKLFRRCCGRSTRLKKYILKTLQIIPKSAMHLPGEGDIILPCQGKKNEHKILLFLGEI